MPIKTKSPQPVTAGAGSKARASRKESAQQPKHTTAPRCVRVSRREIGEVWIGAIRRILAGQAPVRVPEGADDLPGQDPVQIVIGPGAREWARQRRQAGGHVLNCVPGIPPRAYQWPVRNRCVELVALSDGQLSGELAEAFARWLLVRWGAICVRSAAKHVTGWQMVKTSTGGIA